MNPNRLERGLRATFLGMGVNLFLAGVKLVAGVLGHSHALVADAVESLADLVSAVVVWRGLVLAARPADDDHPYGHGKAEPMAAAVVSIILILAGVGIAVKSAQGLFVSHLPPESFTLWVLVVVVVVKEAMFRLAWRVGHESENEVVKGDAWHHRSDAITSLAAALGIGISRMMGPGWERADEVAALFAAMVIGWNGWRLLRPALDELMDTVPGRVWQDRIAAVAMEVVAVRRVETCRVRKMGYSLYVDMHVEVEPDMTVREAHGVAHAVKDRIRSAEPTVKDVLVHVEPFGT